MSFGYSVTDVLTVTQLAWKCFRNAKEACGEYDELTCEADSLHSVLRRLQLEITETDSLFNQLDDDRKEELQRLIAGCDEILRQVDSILNKYDALKAKRPRYGTKSWQRIQFGNHEMQHLDCLRQKMAHHTRNIMFLCTLVGLGSQGKMEMFMRGELLGLRQGVNEILAQKKAETPTNESSILTKYDEDDRAVWKKFRRDLVHKGFDSSFIQLHMEHLKAYVKELGARGALDVEDHAVAHHQSRIAIEGPVRWQLTQDAWLKSHVSITVIEGQSGPRPSPRFLTELSRISKLHGLDRGLLESFSLVGKHRASPIRQEPDPSQDFGAVKCMQGAKSAKFASGSDSQHEKKDLVVRVDASTKNVQPILSRDTCRVMNSRPDGQADNASPSPSTIMPGGVTGSLPMRPKIPSETLSQDSKNDVITVIVPEIPKFGTRATIADWFDLGHTRLPLALRDSHILGYEYEIHTAGLSIWDSILALGHDFLGYLQSQLLKDPLRPWIVISHGLGGSIVKKALTLAHSNYLAHINLLSMLGGLVFLGSPHVSLVQKQSLPFVIRLLKYTSKLPKVELSRAELEIQKVADLCSDFDKLDFDLPIISAYETIESCLSKSFWRPRNEILVDPSFAQTSKRRETLIPVPADHADLCKIELHGALLFRIMAIIDDAHLKTSRENSNQNYMWNASVDYSGAEIQQVMGTEPDSCIALPESSSLDVLPLVEDAKCDVSLPKSATFPIFDVPREADPYFFGREEALNFMDAVLTPRNTPEDCWEAPRPSSVIICGMAAVGKTELALQYTHIRRSHFEAIFWLRADTEQRLLEDFGRIATRCGLLSSLEAQDIVISKHLVLEWLSSTSASWLLVFDNADDHEILHDYWPISNTGAVVVTCRDPRAPSPHFGSAKLDLQPFCPDDAATLFYKVVGLKPHDYEVQACQHLLNRLGGLPLAIVHVGGIMRRRSMSFSDFARLFNETSDRHDALDTSSELRGIQFSSVIELTLIKLPPESLKLLQVISFWDPDSISQRLICPQNESLSVDDIFESKIAYCSARAGCLSLISTKPDHLFVHRLIQEVVRTRIQTKEVVNLFGKAIGLLERAWPTHIDQFDHENSMFGEAQDIVPHVLCMKSIYENMSLQLEDAAERRFVNLLQKAGWVFIGCQNYHIAHSFLSLALRICTADDLSHLEVHADVIYALITLGTRTNYQPFTILNYALEHLNYRNKLNTGSTQCRNSLSMAHCALAHAYMLSGNYTEAIKNCHRSRKVVTDHIEDSRWFEWADIYEAWCLIAMARLEEAETVILQRFAKQRATQEAKGSNSFMLAQTLKSLANLRARQGLLEESFCNHKEALVNFVATTGCNSYEANILCIKVGEHHTRLDQYETAGIYFERAMDWFSVHEFYKPEVTLLHHKIALLRKAQGDEIGANESRAKVEKLYAQLVLRYTGKTWSSDKEIDEVVILTSR